MRLYSSRWADKLVQNSVGLESQSSPLLRSKDCRIRFLIEGTLEWPGFFPQSDGDMAVVRTSYVVVGEHGLRT